MTEIKRTDTRLEPAEEEKEKYKWAAEWMTHALGLSRPLAQLIIGYAIRTWIPAFASQLTGGIAIAPLGDRYPHEAMILRKRDKTRSRVDLVRWNMASQQVVRFFGKGHGGRGGAKPAPCILLALPRHSMVLSSNGRWTIRLWDLATGVEQLHLRRHVRSGIFSCAIRWSDADALHLVIYANNETWQYWRLTEPNLHWFAWQPSTAVAFWSDSQPLVNLCRTTCTFEGGMLPPVPCLTRRSRFRMPC